MSGRKPGSQRGLTPIINHVTPAELKFYTVVEQDLIALAKGSASDLYLSFALSLLSAAVTLVVTLSTTKIESNRVYSTFVTCALVMAINGALLSGVVVEEPPVDEEHPAADHGAPPPSRRDPGGDRRADGGNLTGPTPRRLFAPVVWTRSHA